LQIPDLSKKDIRSVFGDILKTLSSNLSSNLFDDLYPIFDIGIDVSRNHIVFNQSNFYHHLVPRTDYLFELISDAIEQLRQLPPRNVSKSGDRHITIPSNPSSIQSSSIPIPIQNTNAIPIAYQPPSQTQANHLYGIQYYTQPLTEEEKEILSKRSFNIYPFTPDTLQYCVHRVLSEYFPGHIRDRDEYHALQNHVKSKVLLWETETKVNRHIAATGALVRSKLDRDKIAPIIKNTFRPKQKSKQSDQIAPNSNSGKEKDGNRHDSKKRTFNCSGKNQSTKSDLSSVDDVKDDHSHVRKKRSSSENESVGENPQKKSPNTKKVEDFPFQATLPGDINFESIYAGGDLEEFEDINSDGRNSD